MRPRRGWWRSGNWWRCGWPQDGGASEDWTVDATDAVAVEVSAALSISRGLAASHVRYAHALRVQLPALGRVFIAGDIDEATFRAAVFRTGLILDDDLRAAVDEKLAVRAPRWGVLDRSQLDARIDQIVARADRDAVRRRKDRLAEREVVVGDIGNGLAEVVATVYAPDGHAVADQLTALAHTVCDGDPRTMAQRRADGLARWPPARTGWAAAARALTAPPPRRRPRGGHPRDRRTSHRRGHRGRPGGDDRIRRAHPGRGDRRTCSRPPGASR